MRLTAVICVVMLLVAGTALAEKTAIDAKYGTELLIHPSEWMARPYTEGFNTFVPAGWTHVQVNTYETWQLGTYAPYEGTGYLVCYYDSYYSGPQNEWLYYDYTVQAGDDCIVFWAQASPYWAIYGYQNYDILVTINGVTAWSFFNDYDLVNQGTTPYVWFQYSVPLSAYSVGQAIQIGLGYTGFDGAQGGFDALTIGACPPPPPVPCCPFPTTCVTLDYNISDNGFVTKPCNGAAVWQWGVPPVGVPTVACDGVPVTHVLGTNGGFPVLAGESVVLGAFDITPMCYCLEMCHFYDLEGSYDVGNVKVSTDNGVTWTLVYPFGGYPGINVSTSYPSPCAWNEQAFTGTSTTFVRSCFNLTEYVGQRILVKLDLGSDSYATTDIGWFIKWVKLGGEEQSPVESSTWGSIKAMYR